MVFGGTEVTADLLSIQLAHPDLRASCCVARLKPKAGKRSVPLFSEACVAGWLRGKCDT